MNAARIAALVLIVAGILGLVYGSFTYTEETHKAQIGSLELSVKFAWNTLDAPVTHKFLTVPITLRGTVTF